VFSRKTLLITGGTGTFGNTVLNRFLQTDIAEIRIFSRDEQQHDMQLALRQQPSAETHHRRRAPARKPARRHDRRQFCLPRRCAEAGAFLSVLPGGGAAGQRSQRGECNERGHNGFRIVTKRGSHANMIHMLDRPAMPQQIEEMLEVYHPILIKIVVDVRRGVLAGGGEMHADCEAVLLEHGSEQDDLWGANWYPAELQIEFESLINIRPRLGNRSIVIQSEELRDKVAAITRQLLGDVQ